MEIIIHFLEDGREGEETLEEGTKREIKEEFGIDVEVKEKLYEMEHPNKMTKEYFFLCFLTQLISKVKSMHFRSQSFKLCHSLPSFPPIRLGIATYKITTSAWILISSQKFFRI